MVAYVLLAVAQIVGLLLIPFGLPGIWLQAAALGVFAWATGFATVGVWPIVAALLLALIAEIGEFLLTGHFAQRYGGGKRAALGAVLGGIVGAVVGLPLPLVGSVVGAFLGSFVGAAVLEMTTRSGTQPALRAGWGAVLGRLASTALKGGVGASIAALALLTSLR